jgi:peptidoglycan/xylan/chitin deacetylase (PgdA/CDA1 family)/N-acetyl-beta-hexosaminidase
LRRIVLLLSTALAALLLAPASAFGAQVVVSLTFDDGWDSQQTAATMLAAHGMKGTFYVNSSNIGQAGYLTWPQLTAFNVAGNEIAGHTLTHPDLTTLTASQAQHEICDDRTAIQGHGFVVPDFAYPFGAYDGNTGGGTMDVSSIVRNCGYASGRGAFGLRNITSTTDTRLYATSIPPPNLYKILIPCCINNASFGGSTPTAAALENYVQHAATEASPNPGWVAFLFHRICDNCGGDSPAPSMSPTEFNTFLDWLQAGSSGAVVKTVAQVVKNDTQAPTSSIACGGVACSSGWYGGPVSVSLSATDAGTSGVAMIRYTTDGSDPTAASPLYTGPFTVSATTTVKFRAWDNANNLEATKSRAIQIDTTPPTSSIACGGSACSSGWYGGPVSVSLAASDAESGVASIRYTTDGTDPTALSPAYTAPFTVSATATVKYRAFDNAGNAEAVNSQLVQIDTTAPTSSITCNQGTCSIGWYSGPVTVELSAVDAESGVAAIRYTTDGTDPTASSTAYTAPFTISATATVKYRGFDNAGNAESTHAQVIQVDTTAPVSSISCNGSPCSGWYGAPVSVSLAAGDTESGVAAIRYTTDGSDPTASSPEYTAPFGVSSTTTVKFRAWDNVGNVEATNSQLIQVDTTAPTSSISCNGSACSSAAYSADVTVTLSASDGESGVSVIRYTLDGSDPTASSTAYSEPITVSQTTTVKFRAWDNAGNVESTNSQLVTITKPAPDTDPPTSSIACNLDVCSTGWYSGAVSVSLSAADGGSGVAAIRYTTDGSDPTTSSPLYTAPFSVATTTTVKYRAWDNAGNVEAANSQLIQIDTTAPSSSIGCNGSSCSSGWYTASVSVVLSAADSQSGVAVIRYTTDGTDPTTSSPAYVGPFSVAATTTVKYRAWDNVGNAEGTKSQLIQIDTTTPHSSIRCNGTTCATGWYKASVSVTLSATDTDSGVAAIRYTTDGSVPTASSPAYSGPFAVSTTTTVRYRAWDVAGNVEATNSQLIQVDTVPPTVAITSPASGARVHGNVKVTATAADAGSGVAQVSFYADGVLIGTSKGPTYSVTWNTNKVTNGQHTLTAVAQDVAGNSRTSSGVLVTVT